MSVAKIYDVIIIGSGPAGYTAGIYTGRAKLSTLMLSGDQFGGQLMFTTEVENFPGFENGIMGPKLMMEMRKQMQRFGAEIVDAKADKIEQSEEGFRVYKGNEVYVGKSVVIATGADAVRLNLPDEDKFFGRGVSVCAVCDAAFYREKEVYVVGGGDSAIEDAVALTKFASRVYLVVRKSELKASKIMQDRATSNEKIEILWNHEVTGLIGDQLITGLKLLNNATNEERDVKADGLFYAIGHRPNSKSFENIVKLNEKGYILTSLSGLGGSVDLQDKLQSGYPTMTSTEGVFAAGDVVDFRYQQAITSAGAGCQAALDVERYLEAKSHS